MNKKMSNRKKKLSFSLIDVIAERERQVSKGFNAKYDDTHDKGGLIDLSCYVVSGFRRKKKLNRKWIRDWGDHIVTRHGRRKQLVIAAALLLAEVDRIDRKDGVKVKAKKKS